MVVQPPARVALIQQEATVSAAPFFVRSPNFRLFHPRLLPGPVVGPPPVWRPRGRAHSRRRQSHPLVAAAIPQRVRIQTQRLISAPAIPSGRIGSVTLYGPFVFLAFEGTARGQRERIERLGGRRKALMSQENRNFGC
jgi:hypothetical protein